MIGQTTEQEMVPTIFGVSWYVPRPPSSSSGSVTNNTPYEVSGYAKIINPISETCLISSPGGGASCPSSLPQQNAIQDADKHPQRWQLGLPLMYLRRPSQEGWPKGQFSCLLYQACLPERQHKAFNQGVEGKASSSTASLAAARWSIAFGN